MNERVYTQTARARATEETGSRIVDAMLGRFARLPYDDVRLEDVAADAGVTTQTVIRRFGGKAGLMRATVERELGRIADARRAGAGQDPAEVVAELVTHYETYGALIVKTYAEAGTVEGLGPVVAAGRAYHLGWCRDTFGPHLDGTDPATRERRLAQVTALCDASTWRILRVDAALDVEQTRLALAELVLPLLPTAPGPDSPASPADRDGG